MTDASTPDDTVVMAAENTAARKAWFDWNPGGEVNDWDCFYAGWSARDAEVARLREACALMRSMILSGEDFTPTSREQVNTALNTTQGETAR